MLLGFGQIGRALAGHHGEEAERARRNGAGKLRLAAAIDTSGFVFEPGGLTARAVGELADGKQAGASLADSARRAAAPSRPTR